MIWCIGIDKTENVLTPKLLTLETINNKHY